MKHSKLTQAVATTLSFVILALSAGLAPYEAAAQTFAAPESAAPALTSVPGLAGSLNLPEPASPGLMTGPAAALLLTDLESLPLKAPPALVHAASERRWGAADRAIRRGNAASERRWGAAAPALRDAVASPFGATVLRVRRTLAEISRVSHTSGGAAYQNGRDIESAMTGERFALPAAAVNIPAAVFLGMGGGLRANGSSRPARPESVVIRIETGRYDQPLDMPAILGLFKGTGVKIDSKWGPMEIRGEGIVFVRGTTTPEAGDRAKKLLDGVEIFSDNPVQLFKAKTGPGLKANGPAPVNEEAWLQQNVARLKKVDQFLATAGWVFGSMSFLDLVTGHLTLSLALVAVILAATGLRFPVAAALNSTNQRLSELTQQAWMKIILAAPPAPSTAKTPSNYFILRVPLAVPQARYEEEVEPVRAYLKAQGVEFYEEEDGSQRFFLAVVTEEQAQFLSALPSVRRILWRSQNLNSGSSGLNALEVPRPRAALARLGRAWENLQVARLLYAAGKTVARFEADQKRGLERAGERELAQKAYVYIDHYVRTNPYAAEIARLLFNARWRNAVAQSSLAEAQALRQALQTLLPLEDAEQTAITKSARLRLSLSTIGTFALGVPYYRWLVSIIVAHPNYAALASVVLIGAPDAIIAFAPFGVAFLLSQGPWDSIFRAAFSGYPEALRSYGTRRKSDYWPSQLKAALSDYRRLHGEQLAIQRLTVQNEPPEDGSIPDQRDGRLQRTDSFERGMAKLLRSPEIRSRARAVMARVILGEIFVNKGKDSFGQVINPSHHFALLLDGLPQDERAEAYRELVEAVNREDVFGHGGFSPDFWGEFKAAATANKELLHLSTASGLKANEADGLGMGQGKITPTLQAQLNDLKPGETTTAVIKLKVPELKSGSGDRAQIYAQRTQAYAQAAEPVLAYLKAQGVSFEEAPFLAFIMPQINKEQAEHLATLSSIEFLMEDFGLILPQ